MADVTLTYKGATIAELNDSGSKTLRTAGKFCEADIGVEYVKPESGGITPTGTKEITITENGTIMEDVTNYANARIAVDVPSSGGVVSGTFVGNNSKSISIPLSFNPDHVMIFSPYADFGTDNVWNTAVVVYNKNDSYYYGVYLYGTSNIGANKKGVSLVSYQSGNLTISNIPYATRNGKTYYWYAW